MPYTIQGNPLTFKGGTIIVTPVTCGGILANATNNSPINLVIKDGSRDGDATEAEADTNLFGRLVVAGNTKTQLEIKAYASQANLTAPLTPGTSFPCQEGDYLVANITSGMVNVAGTFMISKISETYDPNEVQNIDFTLSSHGNLTVNKRGLITASGTASLDSPTEG